MTDLLTDLHIVSGTLASLAILVALGSRKGATLHRRAGTAAVVALGVSLALAVVVSLVKADHFLLLIALFTAYLLHTGRRAAVATDGAIVPGDRLVFAAGALVGGVMAALGVWRVLFESDYTGMTLGVFGLIALLLASSDLLRGREWPSGQDRIALHLTRMGGSTIAVVTAVAVVNISTDPVYVAWLAPTVLGTPLIALASNRVKRKDESA